MMSVAWETNIFQGSIPAPGAEKIRLARPEVVGKTASQPSGLWAFAVSPYRSKEPNLQGGTAALDQTLSLGAQRPSHLTTPSVSSFISFVSTEPSDQHADKSDLQRSTSAAAPVDVQALYEPRESSSSLQSPINGTICTNETPASSTELSSSGAYIDDVTPIVQDLNTHRHSHGSLSLLEPTTGGFANYEGDFTLFNMDFDGIGEQFTGMLDNLLQTSCASSADNRDDFRILMTATSHL